MARDWNLNPPARVSGEFFDFLNNNAGNPCARLLLQWDNGKTGTAYDGTHWRSNRRVWYGYENAAHDVGIPFLVEFFPGTRWKLDPDADAGTHKSRENFQLIRDYDAEPVPVIFRMSKTPESKRTFLGETITTPAYRDAVAFFPTLPGTDAGDVTCYAHIGQHGTACRGFYRQTDAPGPGDADAGERLRRELESPGPGRYVLEPCKRWTQKHDAQRAANYNASREAI